MELVKVGGDIVHHGGPAHTSFSAGFDSGRVTDLMASDPQVYFALVLVFF